MTNQLFSFTNNFSEGQLILPFGEVCQVAELSILRGTSIDTHVQRCDEITCAISGTATFRSGKEAAILKPGQIHFIRKGVSHTITASTESNFRYLCIGYNPDPAFPAVAALLPKLWEAEHFVLEDDGRMKLLGELLINEFYDWDEHSPHTVNGYMIQLLTTLLRPGLLIILGTGSLLGLLLLGLCLYRLCLGGRLHRKHLLNGSDLIMPGDMIKHGIQLLLTEDLGVGLGLFIILSDDLGNFLGGHTEIGGHLFHTILHKTHL